MAFVPEAALIALREGLEALLITGILLGLVAKLGRPDARKHVVLGFVAACIASLALGLAVQRWLLEPFEERGGAEWFEVGAVAVAVVVLTYMVFWMWSHTRALMATLRAKVESAITRGALVGIVLLTFASVVREGVEVVLFYGALASRATPFDLAWSGLVGFAASAVLVWAILAGVKRFDLQGFFAVTGALLVLVAAGLLVHGVSALMGLGLLPPAPMIWDTSAWMPDESATGRVLHALAGYTAQPTLVQALVYFGYVLGIGGWYLASLGLFTRRTPEGRRLRKTRVTAAALAVIIVAATVGAGAANPGALVEAHAHGDDEPVWPAGLAEGERFGVLLRSHGEPVHYNASTYPSFAAFIKGILVTEGMEELLLIDQGTVLLDKAHPWSKGPRVDAKLMDAWTRDHAGPALYAGTPLPQVKETQLPLFDGFYVAPAGPGLGEPDILEMAGLTAYLEWLQMGNESPMHETKGWMLDAAEALLKARYGDRVVVARSYHILPKVGGPESDADAAAIFREAGVKLVVDAYTSSAFSDVMNTCMMQPHVEHAFEDEAPGVRLVHAGPSGARHDYAHAVADEVARLLAEAPADETIAVFLTHHGQTPGSTNPCGGGVDQYHANAKAMYDAALAAIGETVARPNVVYYQVYGGGAGASDDGVLSPTEALAEAKKAGATRVIDLPFELTGDGFDNLVSQRASWGFAPETAPHYDADRETRFVNQGVEIRIASAAFGAEARAAALVESIEEALSGGAPTHDDQPAH